MDVMNFTKETAKKLVQYFKVRRIITMEDLGQYSAKWRTALTFKYKDLNIISMPPQVVAESL
jgi:gamma-glutamyltranspeptidase/glutathione hydrolase